MTVSVPAIVVSELVKNTSPEPSSPTLSVSTVTSPAPSISAKLNRPLPVALAPSVSVPLMSTDPPPCTFSVAAPLSPIVASATFSSVPASRTSTNPWSPVFTPTSKSPSAPATSLTLTSPPSVTNNSALAPIAAPVPEATVRTPAYSSWVSAPSTSTWLQEPSVTPISTSLATVTVLPPSIVTTLPGATDAPTSGLSTSSPGVVICESLPISVEPSASQMAENDKPGTSSVPVMSSMLDVIVRLGPVSASGSVGVPRKS